MKTKIIIAIIISLIISNKAFTQTDTSLAWVYKHADLTERFLGKFNYSSLMNRTKQPDNEFRKDTASFELKVSSMLLGEFKINGKIIMHVKKTGTLSDYNYQPVNEEQVLLVLNESGKEYFMVHLYFIKNGIVKADWFKYLFDEAPMMCESLINLVH